MIEHASGITMLAAGAGAALTSLGVGVGLRAFALRRRLLDVPNERSSHSAAVPRLGGIGIWVGVAAGATLLLRTGMFPSQVLSVYSCTIVFAIVAVGAFDDIRPLPPWLRLIVHAGASLLFLAAAVSAIPSEGVVLSFLGFGVGLVWLVGLTNAYNFMDGIDGIAAGQAIVASCAWLMLAVVAGEAWLFAPAVLLGSASVGFFVLNWPPARMFMGDAGSTGLGFSFAGLAVLAWTRDPLLGAAGVTFVWPFVFDTSITWFRRLRAGEQLFRPHRSHLYQRLTGSGWSHGSTAALYGVLAFIGSVAGIHAFLWRSVASFSVIPILAGLLWLIVAKAERRGASRGVAPASVG